MVVHVLNEYPPYLYLFQILEHCPKAGLTYMQLWKVRGVDNKLKIPKKSVRTEFLTTLTKFRHDILLIVREGLCNLEENEETLFLELVDFNDEY